LRRGLLRLHVPLRRRGQGGRALVSTS
jgi:hypothetical protein